MPGKKLYYTHFAAHCQISIGNHSDSLTDEGALEVLLRVDNRWVVSKDQKSHFLSLMHTDEDQKLRTGPTQNFENKTYKSFIDTLIFMSQATLYQIFLDVPLFQIHSYISCFGSLDNLSGDL